LRAVFSAMMLFPFARPSSTNPPISNWLVGWHQDTALPLTAKREFPGWGPWSAKDGVDYAHAPAEALEQVLALRVHLDDSTAANGPLRIMPNTHKLGVLTDAEIQKHVGDSPGVECISKTGGIVAMHPLVIHASSKSASELPRRVLHIEYASQLEIVVGLRLAVV